MTDLKSNNEKKISRLKALAKMERGGFWRRVIATVLDILIILSPYLIYLLIRGINRTAPNVPVDKTNVQTFFLDILLMLVWVVYEILFISERGATPGKMMMGLRVIDIENAQYPDLGKSFLRVFAKTASYSFFYLGVLMVAFRKDKSGLHDILVKTVVIKIRK